MRQFASSYLNLYPLPVNNLSAGTGVNHFTLSAFYEVLMVVFVSEVHQERQGHSGFASTGGLYKIIGFNPSCGLNNFEDLQCPDNQIIKGQNAAPGITSDKTGTGLPEMLNLQTIDGCLIYEQKPVYQWHYAIGFLRDKTAGLLLWISGLKQKFRGEPG